MHPRSLLTLLLCLAPAVVAEPWRLQNQGELPGWLTVSGEYRYRVEVMDNTFRVIDPGADQMTSARTLLFAEARGERFFTGFEFQDSRAWWHDDRTPVGTDDVNAAEFLQAYVGVRFDDLVGPGQKLELKLGRMDLSMGNKRIIARNGYRNTINGFTGGRLAWRNAEGVTAQAFYVLPMERLPNPLDREAIRDNDVKNDQSTSDRSLWGIEVGNFPVAGEFRGDAYLLGFEESNRPTLPARQRDYNTVGGRVYDFTGPWQWELEAAWQWGESRATVFSTDDLDHRAGLLHAEVSRGFDHAWKPRVFAKYDYASGDSDLTDDDFERFDTVFAARRRDFGLLGLYGAFFYSNLNSPAVGIKFQPRANLKVESFYRPAWLAEERDFFIGSGVIDPSGDAGNFIGHQFDLRVDWEVLPDQLTFMFGAAYLNKGEFLEDAPLAPDTGDTVYGVSQFILKF